jgi:hypothetical protein
MVKVDPVVLSVQNLATVNSGLIEYQMDQTRIDNFVESRNVGGSGRLLIYIIFYVFNTR